MDATLHERPIACQNETALYNRRVAFRWTSCQTISLRLTVCESACETMETKRKLIELIKNQSALYNTTLSEYKDIATRNEAWKQIAEEMKMTGNIVEIDCQSCVYLKF